MRIAALLLATIAAGGCMTDSTPCAPPTVDEAAAQVSALNLEYIAAAREGNVAWFTAHLAEDAVVILGSGQRVNKPEFLAYVAGGTRRLRTLTVRDVTVRVFDGTVQVDADAPWELADGHRGISRYIDTYAWIDCRWQVISAQINSLPDTTAGR
jgi:hypothetical protein